MIFSGVVDFEHPYNRSTHYTILDHFMKSNDDRLELKWEKLGYKDLNSCYSAWNWSLHYFKLPLTISRIDNHIYIFKEGSIRAYKDKPLNMNKITFEELFVTEEDGEVTLYFNAPKDLLRRAYCQAVGSCISISHPIGKAEPRYCSVEISPTRYNAEEKQYEDYDWTDYTMSYTDIQKFLDLADKIIRRDKNVKHT